MMAWALGWQWSLLSLMWVYLSQSACIGISWFITLLRLRKSSTIDPNDNGKPIETDQLDKIGLCVLFLVHYGGFHVCYASSLRRLGDSIDTAPIIAAAAIFCANQIFSFLYNKGRNFQNQRIPGQKPNLVKLMFFPYVRILPMHITLMIAFALRDKVLRGGGSIALLGLFMLLKTVADVAMYVRQLKGFADNPGEKSG